MTQSEQQSSKLKVAQVAIFGIAVFVGAAAGNAVGAGAGTYGKAFGMVLWALTSLVVGSVLWVAVCEVAARSREANS